MAGRASTSKPFVIQVIEAVGALPPASMPAPHRHVMIVLASFAGPAGENCFPSLATLAAGTGYARSSVAVHVAELEAAGWIVRRARKKGNKQTSNAYELRIAGGPVRQPDQSRSRTSPPAGPVQEPDQSSDRTGVVRELDGGSPGAGHDLFRDLPTDLDLTLSAGVSADAVGSKPANEPPERHVELDAAPREPGQYAPAELDGLIRDVIAEGTDFGKGIEKRITQLRKLSDSQISTLRTMLGERSARASRAAPNSRGRPRDHQVQGGPSFIAAVRAAAEKYEPIGDEIL